MTCKPSVRLYNPSAGQDVATDGFIALIPVDVAEIELGAELIERIGPSAAANLEMRVGATAVAKLL